MKAAPTIGWGDRVVGWLVLAAFAGLAALPIDLASGLCGRLARLIGPLLSANRTARRNLTKAFPEKRPDEIEAILRGVWDNLGRVAGEFPHLPEIWRTRTEVVGFDNVFGLQHDGRPGLFWSVHMANWELPPVGAGLGGFKVGLVYRAANNPVVDDLLRRRRSAVVDCYLPKGSEGARGAMAVLRRGGHLAMLVDQKMNNGIAVPFFGRPAMTAPALALFARHFRCPVVGMRVERLGGAHFRVTAYPAIEFEDTGDAQADTLALMTRVNQQIEDWIREHPEQWLWLHRRWPD